MTSLCKENNPFNENIFLHRGQELLRFMGLPGILMFTRSTVTNSIKTDTSLMLFIKKLFDCMEIGFLLRAIKLDALENDFFPFGAREAFEGVEHLRWHAITVTM
jgi:hypothetical protein